jgi:hypothetical protein
MDQLAEYAKKRKAIDEQYGPLEFVMPGDMDEVKNLNPALVWTLRAPESDSFITNGCFDTDDLEGFYKASKPCLEPLGTVFAMDVLGFDCEDCEDEEEAESCLSCQGTQLIFIDLQEVIKRGEIDISSSEAIWSQRVPGGTFGEICVPADYLNTDHSQQLPRPSWINL